MAAFFLADADARRVVAIGAERGGAAGADPLVAALVALFLLLEALLQLLHDLFPAAERLDLGLFLLGQELFVPSCEPFFGNVDTSSRSSGFQALESVAENLVELVQIALVLHQAARAR